MTPFTVAKAISIAAETVGKVVVGEIDRQRDAVWIDHDPIAVAPYTLCLNSNLIDSEGEEIFEGDYLIDRYRPEIKMLAFYDADRGAFYTSHVETITETEFGGDDEYRYCEFPNATIYRRLAKGRARNLTIVGNLLNELATPEDTSEDTADDEDGDAV